MNTSMTLEIPGYDTPDPYGYYADSGETTTDEEDEPAEEG